MKTYHYVAIFLGMAFVLSMGVIKADDCAALFGVAPKTTTKADLFASENANVPFNLGLDYPGFNLGLNVTLPKNPYSTRQLGKTRSPH